MERAEYILMTNLEVLESYYDVFEYWYQIDPNLKRSVKILHLPTDFLN